MTTRNFFYSALLACVLLPVLFAMPCVLTWRSWRQERQDQALIGAVKQRKTQLVVALLQAGANANAQAVPTPKTPGWQFPRFIWRKKAGAAPSFALPLLIAVDQRSSTGNFYPETLSIVRALVNKGANVNVVDRDGETPLLRLFEGHPAFPGNDVIILPEEHAEVVQLLLETGANTEVPRYDGKTALMVAVSRGFSKSVGLLLAHGANPNAQDEYGQTALHLATQEDTPTLETVVSLVAHGAKVNLQDRDGNTPLMTALEPGNDGCIRFLLTHGAVLDIKNHYGSTALWLAHHGDYAQPRVAKMLRAAGAKE